LERALWPGSRADAWLPVTLCCDYLLTCRSVPDDALNVAAELTSPLRFYVVLSAVVAGIGGLWFATLPLTGPNLPPSPACRRMIQRAQEQANQAERAERCTGDDF
jgi:hypothetical protein